MGKKESKLPPRIYSLEKAQTYLVNKILKMKEHTKAGMLIFGMLKNGGNYGSKHYCSRNMYHCIHSFYLELVDR